LNPLDHKKAAHAADKARRTFGECADELIKSKRPEWRSKIHAEQWRMTLETYCAPIRDVPADLVDTQAVLGVLNPLWARVPETASRLRGRIESVLDFARARGLIPQDRANPARWKGHLEHLLPKRQKLSRKHFAAMAYVEIPNFLSGLRERESVASLALEFAILTAARSGEVLGMRWGEVDLAAKVWEVPAHRMKAGMAHRIPLCDRTLGVLECMAQIRTGDFVFPGQKRNCPISSSALEMVLRRNGGGSATVHGFRSAFRDFCADRTSSPRELAEAALGHRAGDVVELAYRRTDFLERRRELMSVWAKFCEAKESNIISIAARK
jgi:integrase